MTHILCMTTGLTGIVNASFEVVRRLEARGHRLTYACPWQPARETVERQGIAYYPLPAVDFDPAPLPRKNGRPAGVLRAWVTASGRRQQGLAALGMEAFAELLAELRPDLIVADVELPEHIIKAVSEGYPIALMSHFFGFWKRAGVPPVNRLMTPEDGRLRMALAWLELGLRRRWHVVARWLRTGGTDRRSVLRAYARQMGFPARELELVGWLMPFGFRSLPILHMTALELEFPHTPRTNVHYVGPMVASDRRDRKADGADSSRLDRAISGAKRDGRRILYGSLSSKDPGDSALIERLVSAVRERDDWQLIVALGGQIEAGELGQGAPNVEAFDWLPQLEVLRHADLSINHGGIHTIHECLHHRVPMVVYSGQRYDQNGGAARVRSHGLGLAEDKSRAGVDDIRRHIETVLDDATFNERVSSMQEHIESYRRSRRLERTVESLLAGSRS